MLLCDTCDKGFHTYCIGLDAIPTGEWVCTTCTASGPGRARPQKLDEPQTRAAEPQARRVEPQARPLAEAARAGEAPSMKTAEHSPPHAAEYPNDTEERARIRAVAADWQ